MNGNIHAAGQKHLWEELASASIYIKKLVVEDLTSSLLDYLKGYAGLEDFFLVVGEQPLGRMDNATEEAAIKEAKELSHYSTILPMHKENLVLFKGLNVLTSRAPNSLAYDDMICLSAELHTLIFTLNVSEIESSPKIHEIVSWILAFQCFRRTSLRLR
jgi:hypothetical protein